MSFVAHILGHAHSGDGKSRAHNPAHFWGLGTIVNLVRPMYGAVSDLVARFQQPA